VTVISKGSDFKWITGGPEKIPEANPEPGSAEAQEPGGGPKWRFLSRFMV
jgi:hypothetical protein